MPREQQVSSSVPVLLAPVESDQRTVIDESNTPMDPSFVELFLLPCVHGRLVLEQGIPTQAARLRVEMQHTEPGQLGPQFTPIELRTALRCLCFSAARRLETMRRSHRKASALDRKKVVSASISSRPVGKRRVNLTMCPSCLAAAGDDAARHHLTFEKKPRRAHLSMNLLGWKCLALQVRQAQHLLLRSLSVPANARQAENRSGDQAKSPRMRLDRKHFDRGLALL